MISHVELYTFHICDFLELIGARRAPGTLTIMADGEGELVEFDLEDLCMTIKLEGDLGDLEEEDDDDDESPTLRVRA